MEVKKRRSNNKSILKTISIPKEVYTLLDQLAKDQNISVHTLIIEMLKYNVAS